MQQAKKPEDLLHAVETPEEPTKPKTTGWKGPYDKINRKGRPKRDAELDLDALTNKELKDRELLTLLRKFKPHVATAIMTAANLMQDSAAQEGNKLRAADLILKNFHRLILDVYDGDHVDPEKPGEEIQKQSQPVFSLRMINDEENKE